MSIYGRVEYEMSEEDLAKLIDACAFPPSVLIGYPLLYQQEYANAAWAALGKKMGFNYLTVRPIPHRGLHVFSAVPKETKGWREKRLGREMQRRYRKEVARLKAEIEERQQRLGVVESLVEKERKNDASAQ